MALRLLPPVRRRISEVSELRGDDPRRERDEDEETDNRAEEGHVEPDPTEARSYVRRSDVYVKQETDQPRAVAIANPEPKRKGMKNLREETRLIGVETHRPRLYVYIAPRTGPRKKKPTGT